MNSKCRHCKSIIKDKEDAVLVAFGNAEFDNTGIYDSFNHKKTYLYHQKCFEKRVKK